MHPIWPLFSVIYYLLTRDTLNLKPKIFPFGKIF
jgi:hypothetical protein